MKRKQGISLIVLIITIVVIIILATAIIVNIANTNLIENANEAVVKQDIKVFQDELTLYIADKYVDMKGKFEAEDLDEKDSTKILEIIPSIKGTKYEGYIVIEDGKLAVLETMPEPDKTWAMEALGLVEVLTNTPIVAVNTKVESANATITGGKFTYNNPVIPVGFKAVNDGASWNDDDKDGVVDGWNDGLVIQDEIGNEFVWVPCTLDGANGTITYTKNLTYPSYYTPTSENTSDDLESLPMKDETTRVDGTVQITKYGGFYIGRYESGVPVNQNEIDGTSGDTSNKNGTPVVQQGAIVWTCIDYNMANTNAKLLINTTNVKSGLITGTGWDTVCTWINSETDSEGNIINSVIDSRSWGNYSDTIENAQYDTDGKTKISGIKQTAGYSEYWKAKNIYDLAGNTWEWTGEKYSTTRINRGGRFHGEGLTSPATCRNNDNISNAHGNISFRIMLYVM